MNKFDNIVENYYKKHNLTEADQPNLQTGNVITNFFSNIQKKFTTPFDFKSIDYLVKLNTSIENLKKSSKPNFNTAITNYSSRDPELAKLKNINIYADEIISFYNDKNTLGTFPNSTQVSPFPSVKNDTIVRAINTAITNTNIAEIKNIKRSLDIKIEAREKMKSSIFISPPPYTDKKDAISKINKNKIVVDVVDNFYDLIINNKPTQFSLVQDILNLNKNAESREELQVSNLTLDDLVVEFRKIFGNTVIFTSQSTGKSALNKGVDLTAKGIGSAIKGVGSYLSQSANQTKAKL